jgi:hypothetical protein
LKPIKKKGKWVKKSDWNMMNNMKKREKKMIEWLRWEHDEQYEEKKRLERINFKIFR